MHLLQQHIATKIIKIIVTINATAAEIVGIIKLVLFLLLIIASSCSQKKV